jgi:F-type H+-transporting ATPase subunit delta
MNVARTYAKVLYETACENKNTPEVAKTCDELERALSQLAGLIKTNHDLRVVLESPIATGKEKSAVLAALGEKLGQPDLLNRFLSLLAAKGRLSSFGEIAALFRVVRLEAEGGIPGQLVSAEAMSESDIESLAQAFSKKLGKRVSFDTATDADLLAGVKVTVGGVTYDGTLRTQLEKLRDQFVSAATNV